MNLNRHEDTTLKRGVPANLKNDDTDLSDETLDYALDRIELCVTCQSCGRKPEVL